MYDFDKKSKQNIRAIYYIVSTFAAQKKATIERDFSEALNSEISCKGMFFLPFSSRIQSAIEFIPTINEPELLSAFAIEAERSEKM